MKVAIYARVSTEEQNLETQIDHMIDYCKRMGYEYEVFKDVMSGAKDNRPEFNHMMERIRLKEFDILMVWKLDRLGRSLQHLIQILQELEHKGIQFISLSQSIDTTTPQGKFFFHILGAFAEFEKDLISQRTKERLQYLKKQGKKLGRPKISKYQRKKAMELYKQLGSINKVAKSMRISYGTAYNIIKGIG